MPVRGVRGATTIAEDTPSAVLDATRELLQKILNSNPEMVEEDIASVVFTTTEDIHSEYPAKSARELGWVSIPLLCTQEIPVPGCLPRCIRVLLHWNTDFPQSKIQHVYLREAVTLRPDLTESEAQISPHVADKP